nr:N-acetylmuramoyl-L-alanine amidase-like domain-containing protein [Legionella norrlandica]
MKYATFRSLLYFAFSITSIYSYGSNSTTIEEKADTGLAKPALSNPIASNSITIEEQADTSIKKLYHILNTTPNTSMAERINQISAYFKGAKYILGSLGEGPIARYDQFPRYRVDGFDCDTYVNTVLSLALSNSLESFQECLKHTRYKNGKRSYLNRNHFTSVDWNNYNQQRGLLKDITLSIQDERKQSVALLAKALINKPGWYEYKTLDTIRLQQEDKIEQKKRLIELKAKGKKLEITDSEVLIFLSLPYSQKIHPIFIYFPKFLMAP